MIVDIIKRTAVIDVRIGPRGRAGINGTNGQGVPTGGTTGQILAKNSGTNYDTGWINLNLSWDGISGKPSTFPPSAHNQAWATITGTPTTLAGYGIADGITAAAAAAAYAPIDHTQAISTITGLQSALDDRVLSSLLSSGGSADTVALRDAYGSLTSLDFFAYDAAANFSTRVSAGVLTLFDTTSSNVMNITPPTSLSGPVNVQWPSTSGTLLNASSPLPAANLTGTINTARLPATITGLTSVTSTTFVGALTGTASGNLVSGGALGTPSSGVLTNCTSIPAGQLTGTISAARLPSSLTSQLSSSSGFLGTSAGATTPAFGAAINPDFGIYFESSRLMIREGNNAWAGFGDTASGVGLIMTANRAIGWSGSSPDGSYALQLQYAAAASLQLGANHATTATNQTIKAHNVTTGTGPNLILSGGTGSVANGVVIISRLPTSNPGPGILWNNAGTPAIGT